MVVPFEWTDIVVRGDEAAARLEYMGRMFHALE